MSGYLPKNGKRWLWILSRTIPAFLLAFSLFSCSSNPSPPTTEGNDYPIVLLHGFAGWGPEEMWVGNVHLLYWGGFRNDIQKSLNDNGMATMTAVVGPLSSNWDRACEFYAYLRGGQVDYGAHHSQVHQHARYGRTFAGIYPQWNDTNKIHIVAHSMGGQTARVLIELLRNGDADEISSTPPGELSDLFEGGRSWVHSLFTISSTHNGTTLTERLKRLFKEMCILLDAILEPEVMSIYDFKLDQWGLTPLPGESFLAFLRRVLASPLWVADEADFSTYDVSPEGAMDINLRVGDDPDVFQFSLGTRTTYPIGEFQAPAPSTMLLFHPTSWYMGLYSEVTPGRQPPKVWRPGDGVVNSISMIGPWLGRARENILTYSYAWPPEGGGSVWDEAWPPQRGVWNYMGNVGGADGNLTPVCHSTIIGIMPSPGQRFHDYGGPDGLENLYLSIGRLLRQLPPE